MYMIWKKEKIFKKYENYKKMRWIVEGDTILMSTSLSSTLLKDKIDSFFYKTF